MFEKNFAAHARRHIRRFVGFRRIQIYLIGSIVSVFENRLSAISLHPTGLRPRQAYQAVFVAYIVYTLNTVYLCMTATAWTGIFPTRHIPPCQANKTQCMTLFMATCMVRMLIYKQSTGMGHLYLPL